jgi:hypothetical protein
MRAQRNNQDALALSLLLDSLFVKALLMVFHSLGAELTSRTYWSAISSYVK